MPSYPNFIVLEGIDGAGKTAQVQRLAQVIPQALPGAALRLVREPGSTPLGEELRRLLAAHRRQFHPWTQALLFNAARCELVQSLLPWLCQGGIVLADRYAGSTLAYRLVQLQQHPGGQRVSARNLEREIRSLCALATQGGTEPGLTILLSPDDDELSQVLRRKPDQSAQDLEFLTQVRDRYLELAGADPSWTVIPTTGRSQEEIAGAVQAAALAHLRRKGTTRR